VLFFTCRKRIDGKCVTNVICLFQINEFNRSQSANARLMTVEEVAMGFIQVANEAMCRPIRALTQVEFVIITRA